MHGGPGAVDYHWRLRRRAMKSLLRIALPGLLAGLVAATSPSAVVDARQAPTAPTNDLPNPYQTIEGWAKMPAGRTWGSTSSVAIDKDGTSVWAAERCGANSCVDRQTGKVSGLDVIMKFDPSGTMVKSFGAGMFIFPHGMYVDRDGNIWLTDGQDNQPRPARAGAPAPEPPAKIIGHQVIKFSSDGKVLMTLGKAGGAREPEFFYQPNAVYVAPDGSIFVSEGHSSSTGSTARILKFSKDGTLIKTFGTLGTGPDGLDQPHTLAMDSRGRLFVGDRNNNRIQIFDQDLKLLDSWPQFSRPSGIVIDAHDVIYVADSESESISRGSNGMHGHEGWKRGIRIGNVKDGKVQYFIPDPVADTTNTSSAEGIAVDANGVIYGAEVGGKTLKRYVKK
jgi:sugar lactone lactonase YvrE